MQHQSQVVVRDRLAPRIDTRIVLTAYAVIALVVGFTVTGTGIRGIEGMPQAYASVIYIGGMLIAAAGCAAWGLALNDDPVRSRSSLIWFGAGHLLLGLMAWMQWELYWSDHGVSALPAIAPLVIGFVLLALSILGGLSGAAEPAATTTQRRIRSSYNEHIIQIARREERARLARDLHDAVKQQLFVIQTAAATAQTRFDDDPAGAREAVTQVRTAAREATAEMGALLDELQAAPMENTGLVEVLKKQCEALALRTGAQVSFEPGTLPPPGSLRPGAHEVIYRVAQEALANVARHARATRVVVSLQWNASRLDLRVTDNGKGVEVSRGPTGMGISNMRERAAEMGGQLLITPGSPGTEILLSVPSTHPAIRGAWASAAAFALIALSAAVFYGIRGPSPDRRTSLVTLAVFAAWVAFSFGRAYRKVWTERAR